VIVENLLDLARHEGLFHGDRAAAANSIVQSAWDRASTLVDGSRAPRPHKLTLAAISLADAIKYNEHRYIGLSGLAYCLRVFFESFQVPDIVMALTQLDEKLLELAAAALDEADKVLGPDVVADQMAAISIRRYAGTL
jgi:hypothetical protein